MREQRSKSAVPLGEKSLHAETSAVVDASGSDGRWAIWFVMLVTVLVYLVNSNSSPLGDSAAAFPVATSIVNDWDLTLNEYESQSEFSSGGWVDRNPDGDLVNYFPWAVGLAAVPVVAVIEAVSQIGVGDGAEALVLPMGRGHALLQSIAASLWTSAAVAGVYVFVRREFLERSWWFAAVVAWIFAFGTSAWSTAAFQLWQHGPSLAAVTWSLVILQRFESIRFRSKDGQRLWVPAAALGVLVGLAVIFRPTNALVAVCVTLLLLLRYRHALPGFFLGGVSVAIPWLLATRSAYGSWLQPYGGSDRIRLHSAYLEALAANLVSPGRGILVFSPIVVVSLWGLVRVFRPSTRPSGLEILSTGVVILYWLTISALPHWTGGYSFGPRLFTDALPFLVVLALPVVRSLFEPGDRCQLRTSPIAAVALLAVLSIGVHAQSTLVISTRCWNRYPVDVDAEYGRVWSVADPMVIAGYRDLVRAPSESLRGLCTR